MQNAEVPPAEIEADPVFASRYEIQELNEPEFELESIIDHREADDGATFFQVKYKGFDVGSDPDHEWQPDYILQESAPGLLASYQEKINDSFINRHSSRSRNP